MEEMHEIRVGTWNVQTMNAMGKLENVKEEMRRNGLSKAQNSPNGNCTVFIPRRCFWKGKRKVYREGKQRIEEKQRIRVGTWNVRTMNVMGKLENVKEEMG